MNTTHNTSAPVTCKHCRAFNGKSHCGCAAARLERGEKPAAPVGVAVEW
jgi:hypothetical protein